jgi:hypothetical protein
MKPGFANTETVAEEHCSATRCWHSYEGVVLAAQMLGSRYSIRTATYSAWLLVSETSIRNAMSYKTPTGSSS